MGGIMNYAVEMGSIVVIYSYIPSFIKIGSGIQKVLGRIHRYNQQPAVYTASQPR
jgi:hypothetical protein